MLKIKILNTIENNWLCCKCIAEKVKKPIFNVYRSLSLMIKQGLVIKKKSVKCEGCDNVRFKNVYKKNK